MNENSMCVMLYVCACPCRSLYVCVSLRHSRCFWFSGQSGGDHCKAGVSEGGVASMHGLGAVWRQDAAILPHTSCDGQTGLVPHGFRKRQLMSGEMGGAGDGEEGGDGRVEILVEKKNHLIGIKTVQQMQNHLHKDTNLYTNPCTKHAHTLYTRVPTMREGAITHVGETMLSTFLFFAF